MNAPTDNTQQGWQNIATAPKPTIQEIAAMPFPASVEAMRKHYNPHWGKDVPEDGEKRTFDVRVEWSVNGSESYTVEAFSEDEAEDLALEEFDSDPAIPDGAEVEGTYADEKSS